MEIQEGIVSCSESACMAWCFVSATCTVKVDCTSWLHLYSNICCSKPLGCLSRTYLENNLVEKWVPEFIISWASHPLYQARSEFLLYFCFLTILGMAEDGSILPSLQPIKSTLNDPLSCLYFKASFQKVLVSYRALNVVWIRANFFRL
jgi:hypothetical protein